MLVIFASTPEQDMVLIVDKGYGEFSELEQVSDEQMANVERNVFHSAADGAGPLTRRDLFELGWLKEFGVTVGYTGMNGYFSITEYPNNIYNVTINLLGSSITITGTEVAIISTLTQMIGQVEGVTSSLVAKIKNKINNM